MLITPANVVRVPIATLARIVDEAPRVRQKLVALSARRLKDALSSQLRGRNLDGDANLADHLMRLAEDFGRYVGNYAVFAEKIAQTDIAADLGIGRRALTDRLQSWTEAGLIRTTPLTLLDVRRIEQLRKVGTEEPVVLIEDTVRKIRQMLDAGDLHAARAMSIDVGKFFPASPALAFMGALAAARSDRPNDAGAILDAAALLTADPDTLHRRVTLGLVRPASAVAETVPEGPDFDDLVSEALGGVDPGDEFARLKPMAAEWTREILALRGRIAKDQALTSGDKAQAKRAADRYLETDRFQSRSDPFPAINAASLLVMAGDRKAGETLARRVIGDAKGSDYWTLSSVAEAHLIVGDAKAALATAKRSMEASHSDGMVASTRRQLRRMAPVLGNVGPILDILTVRRPIVYSGTMMRPDQFDDVAAVEAHAKAAIEALLAEDRIGAAYGALARGADIVIAEALVEAGIELNVVLPFDDADFIAQSVAIGGDDGWTERFDELINRCSSVTIAQPGSPQARDLDMSFRHGFRMAGALAAERAAFLETTPLLIAMTIAEQHKSVAGTGGDVADWEGSGREVYRIELPFSRNHAPKASVLRHGFSATLFYFPSEGDEGEAEAVLAKLTRKLKLEDAKILPRKIKGGRTGAAATLQSVADTLKLAFALNEAGGKTGRVICDYGPVFGRSGNVDAEALARLAGAADFAGFPADRVLAAAPFAAEVIFSRTPGVSAIAAGQRAYRATERGRLRIVPASGVYELVAE